jgi:hypothetical protein
MVMNMESGERIITQFFNRKRFTDKKGPFTDKKGAFTDNNGQTFS